MAEVFDTKVTNVYILQAGDLCKVGVSVNVGSRMASLQADARKLTPAPLSVAAVFTPLVGRAFDIESRAHKALAKKRVKGEWFRVRCDDAEAAITRPYLIDHGCWDDPDWAPRATRRQLRDYMEKPVTVEHLVDPVRLRSENYVYTRAQGERLGIPYEHTDDMTPVVPAPAHPTHPDWRD